MSTRSRSQPWFRERRSMSEVNAAAQFHYGWHDWSDPFQATLERATRCFYGYQPMPRWWLW